MAQALSMIPRWDHSTGVFDELFDSIPDAMIATDTNGIIIHANACAGRLFSRRSIDLEGMSMEQLLPQRFRAQYAAHRAEFVRTGATTAPELETYGQTADGVEVPFDATVGRFEDAGTTYILMVIREVTDRKANEEKLERRVALEELVIKILGSLNSATLQEIDERILQSLADLGSFARSDRSYIFEKSEDGTTWSNTYEWCSPGTESQRDELQDLPLESFPWILGQIEDGRVVEIPSVENLPPEARVEQRFFRQGKTKSMVNLPMVAGGEVVGLIGLDSCGLQETQWPADEISTFMVVQDFFANALRRRRIEEELQRANRMLSAVSECNDALVRATGEETLLSDVCRIVVEAGGYKMAWVGMALNDPEQSVQQIAAWGDSYDYLDGLHLTWADRIRGNGPAGTAIRTRTPVALQNVATDPGMEFAREGALKAGYQSTICVPFFLSDGAIGVLAVYASDLAAFDAPEIAVLQRFADDLSFGIDALRMRDRRQEAEAQLRATLRSKDEFLATIAHELRTPLTAVVGFAQVLTEPESGLSPTERFELVQTIADEGIDLTNIIDDLLVAAKAEAGTLKVTAVKVDLRAQAAQVLETLEPAVSDGIEFTGPSSLASGDPARVRQILRNLVSNALRYGGDNIRVCVSSDASAARVIVVDKGVGVPIDDRESIFEPYQRAHNAAGLTASMGLGLTVSRKLARLMGGDLTYRREGDESVFALTLPLLDA